MERQSQIIDRLISNITNTLIYSNLWVALSAGSITFFIFIINNIVVNYEIVVMNSSLTFLSYNYIYIVGNRTNPEKMEYQRKRWMDKNLIPTIILNSLALIYAVCQLFYISKFQWIILFTLSFLSLFYLLPNKKNIGLRWLPGLKIVTISVSWAMLIMPFSFYSQLSTSALITQGIIVFLFVIALAIPFDLRDLHDDSADLKTIPQLLGSKNALRLSQLIFILIGILIVIESNEYQNKTIHILFTVISLLLVEKSNNRKINYYNFWIEGIPFFWLTAILIFGK
nr:hypothetical protein [uncultured Carboxylicivirga sp.]